MHHRRTLHRKGHRPLRQPGQPLVLPQAALVAGGEAMSPMRALTLVYHEDLEEEITGIIQQMMLVARYTRIRDVIGARTDAIQEADYLPRGQNHMLILVATQEVVNELAQALRALRQRHGHGLRGYVTTVEGLI